MAALKTEEKRALQDDVEDFCRERFDARGHETAFFGCADRYECTRTTCGATGRSSGDEKQ
jgi:hypothetical protein